MQGVEQVAFEPTLVDGDGRSRYVLRGLLGEGAVGRVSRAFDVSTGREVALKTLKLAHFDHVYALKQEFRSLRDITHPNLVRLYELVVGGDLAYFTMELVEGVNLLDWVWEGGAPTPGRPLAEVQLGRVRAAFSQLACALDTLHGHGRLHRDVKPSNVLVTADGRVVLVDLGISVDVASALGRASMSGRVSGTLGYMSPEQANGIVLQPSSDWYTFGVLLYQALTGVRPSASQTRPWLLGADADEHTTTPRSSPIDLAQLTASLLQEAPDARPQASQILAALPGSRTSMMRLRSPRTRLVGREAEVEQLMRALNQSHATGVRVATVTGPSGVGKTTLVEAFLEQAARTLDARVLRARCHHREKVSFKALDGIIDDLSEHLCHMPRSELAEYVPARLGALLRVFPLLTRAFGVPIDGPALDSSLLRPGALSSLRNLLAKLALARPLILWVDDLQWVDRDSLMALQAIVGPTGAPGYLVVLSHRAAGIEEERFINELLADVGASRRADVPVGPLEAPDVLELIRDVAPALSDPAQLELVRTSGGMPLLASEFARDLDLHVTSLGEEGLEGRALLSRLLTLRLSHLSESAQTAFGLLCVAGFPLEERALFRMVGDRAGFALVELTSAGLVRDLQERGVLRLEVAHDQLSETFLEGTPTLEIERLTDLLWLALAELGTSDPLFQVEMLSLRSPQQALVLAQEAAMSARARGAIQLEAMLLDRASSLALDETPPEVLADLGRALLCCGRSQDGASQLALAAEMAQARGDLFLATRYRAAAGEHLIGQGHTQEGLTAMTRALAVIGVKYERTEARALAWMVLHWPAIAWHKALYRLRRRTPVQISPEVRMRMDVLWAAGAAVAHSDPIHAMQFHGRHALLAYGHGDTSQIALSTCEDAVIGSMRGGARRWQGAERSMAEAKRLAQDAGDAWGQAFIEAQVAAMHYFAGNWALVLEQVPLAHAALSEARSERISQTGLLCFLEVTALLHLGRLNEGRARTAELKVALAASGNGSYEKCLRLGWNQMACIAWDEIEPAERDLLRAEPHLTPGRFSSVDYVHLLAKANLELYQGRGASAFELVESAWSRVRRSMQLMLTVPHFDLWELRARVALAAASSEAPALRRLSLRVAQRAIRALSRNPLPMAAAAVEGLRASLALIRGAGDDARHHLRLAIEAYEQLGLALRAECCRLLLGSLPHSEASCELDARRWFDAEQVVFPDRFAWVFLPSGPAPPRQRGGSQRSEELVLQAIAQRALLPRSCDDTVTSDRN
jgi:hypothetical protein